MNSKEILGALGKVVPTIASALGGPFAGLAAGFIADKLGISDKTAEGITNLVSGAGPQELLRLKEIDADLQKYFAGLGIKELELEVTDRDSARKREMQVLDKTPRNLAYLLTLGFFLTLGYLIKFGFPEDSKDVVIYMLGVLNVAWTGAIAYYYGTTRSSSQKNELLASFNRKEK